ncbi:MAG TPA: M4 family metallopeptidase [Pyrinomonadaceae bacterium]|nr:M4 family metallopeptidase [Pyrinomonadaceae bacterium]
MNRVGLICILAVMPILLSAASDSLQIHSAGQSVAINRDDAIQKFQNALVGRGHLKRNRATGLVDFARLDRTSYGSLVQSNAGGRREKTLALVNERREAFGLHNPSEELKFANEQQDREGNAHLTFSQTYQGVPVFGGMLKAHFNSAGELRTVNGVVVPDIQLNTTPTKTSDQATALALAKVQNDKPGATGLTSTGAKLYIYRTGLAQGVPGENHLVWEIAISNFADISEFVYVDAHSGKLVDQITGTYEGLDRRIYEGQNIPAFLPPSFPSNPFWTEGQQFPTGNANADEVIASTKETYDLFKNGFGRDSFDDLGSAMFSVFDSGYVPGNAQAFPTLHLALFGRDLTADDIIAHEWTHIYTAYTDNLVYQWQPGALNEAYSDIFGETVDLLNGRGLDTGGQRQANDCARPLPMLHVNSPSFLVGDYAMARSTFGPPFEPSGINGNIVLIDDGTGSRTDGCQIPYRNAKEVSGRIALIDRSEQGTCTYSEKVKNAQLNGAIAVILANDISLGDQLLPMLGLDPTVNIPSAIVGFSAGQALRSPKARTINVTITGTTATSSKRWEVGEQTQYAGIRDMWNPRCYANPGKVSDREYFCGTFDQGGAHENSGVPNHAYALLVDGGTYNGQVISPIGFTKAAHIYFRAMSFYQTPTSDFADHAEALEAAASDLIGANLPDLTTGLPSGQSISLFDLDQVHKATLAVELRTPPTQCGFQPLLAKNPPQDTCPAAQNAQIDIFKDDFESDPNSRWIITRDVADAGTFMPRDWSWVHELPDGHSGSGFFAPDPGDDCTSPDPGQVGVLHLDSPLINLPRVMIGGPHLSFDHYVSIETGFDGGQLMISVNDGPFQLVDPRTFIYNPYNMKLFPADAGFEVDTNPRAGQPAFSGNDGGSVDGSWGTSIVDLTTYAHAGDRIRFRWDLSTDYCSPGNFGWYLDNVRVYSCRP